MRNLKNPGPFRGGLNDDGTGERVGCEGVDTDGNGAAGAVAAEGLGAKPLKPPIIEIGWAANARAGAGAKPPLKPPNTAGGADIPKPRVSLNGRATADAADGNRDAAGAAAGAAPNREPEAAERAGAPPNAPTTAGAEGEGAEADPSKLPPSPLKPTRNANGLPPAAEEI